MTYTFKWLPEAVWAAGITFITFVGTGFLATGDATDWRVWLTATLTGGARAAVGAALAYVPKLLGRGGA